MKIAVVGATGLVGQEMLRVIEQRELPFDELLLVASERSVGKEMTFKGKTYKVISMQDAVDQKPDVALFSAGGSTSITWAPKFAENGTIVIDNSSAWRMDPTKKLIVPEINGGVLRIDDRIIANPNCSTIQMVVAMKPLHDLVPINRCVVSTYQSVSGAGKEGMDELFAQTKGIYMNEPTEDHRSKFTKQIAFNCIPHIDKFMDDGSTKEEWKMVVETKKILDPGIKVHATCVRVPVFVGHGEAVNLEFDGPIDEDEARRALQAQPGITVLDDRADGGYVTQKECAGEDDVYVSRLRSDPTVENGLSMWVVSDNLRKGAALNTVQIAETLVGQYMEDAA